MLRLKPLHAYLLIALLAVLPYLNALPGDFVYDDTRLITGNEHLKDWNNLWRGFGMDYYASTTDRITLGYYRPVTVGITLIDYQLWGSNPMGYHITNLLFHTADSLLLYRIAAFFLPMPFSVAAAALFAVHPVHTETVTFISGRVDAIAAFFYLMSLLLFLKWREAGGSMAQWRYGMSLFLFFLGLLSKEMAITMPFAVALVLFVQGERMKGVTIRTAPYLAVVAAYLALRYGAIGHLTGQADFSLGTPLFIRTLTAVKIAAYYLYLLIFPPAGLNMEPPMSLVKGVGDPQFLLSLVVVCAVATGALLPKKRNSAAVFGTLWFFVSLGPVLNLIPIETLAAERFLYLPSAGFSLAVAALFSGFAGWLSAGGRPGAWKAIAPMLVVIALFLPMTVYRNTYWQNDAVLWTEKLRTDPGLAKAYDHIGSYHLRRGNTEEGITAFRQLVQLAPRHARAHYNIGVYLEKKGLYAEAGDEYSKAVKADPAHTAARYNLGTIYWREGRSDLAYEQWEEILRIQPDHEGALYWIRMRR